MPQQTLSQEQIMSVIFTIKINCSIAEFCCAWHCSNFMCCLNVPWWYCFCCCNLYGCGKTIWEHVIVIRVAKGGNPSPHLFPCKSKPPPHLLPHEQAHVKPWGGKVIKCHVSNFGSTCQHYCNSVCCLLACRRNYSCNKIARPTMSQ